MDGDNDQNISLYPKNCSYLMNLSSSYNDSECSSYGLFEGREKPENILATALSQICYVVAALVGLSGNILVIYVVARFSKMQTVTNLYILNLALADAIFLLGTPFLVTTAVLGYWPFGDVMCKLYMVLTSLNQFTSSMFLTVMSADRYIAVCHPISSPKYRTPIISKFVSLTAWTISAFMIIPIFMYSNALVVDSDVNCNIFWPDTRYIGGVTIFTLYGFLLGFGLPITLIVIFYTLVLYKLKTVGPKNRLKDRKKRSPKVTRMVLAVITVYILCWLPYWVLQITLIFTPPRRAHSSFNKYMYLFTFSLCYINSAINPILYAFLSENFKKSFMKACSCITGGDPSVTLHPEISMLTRRQRSIVGSTRTKSTPRNENQSEDGASNQLPASKEVSTAVTNTSRTPTNNEQENHRNGKLLEVPNVLRKHLLAEPI